LFGGEVLEEKLCEVVECVKVWLVVYDIVMNGVLVVLEVIVG